MEQAPGLMNVVDGQPPRHRMRAADSDRKRVAEQLRSAHDEGRLDLGEYDERVQQAWVARTYGELEALTADLLQPRRDPAARGEMRRLDSPHCRAPSHGHGRQAVAAWAGASAINLAIWAIVSLITLSWVYPWWIWVAGPWGAVLLIGWLSRRGQPG
jgi:hypothetical protein